MPQEKLNAKDQLYNDLQTEEGRARLLRQMEAIDPGFSRKVEEVLAKVTKPNLAVSAALTKFSKEINKAVKPCLDILSPHLAEVSRITTKLIKDSEPFLSNFSSNYKKAKQRADDIEKILTHGSLGELVNIDPIDGLTLALITGQHVAEIKEIEKKSNEVLEKNKAVNKKKGKGGETRGINSQEERGEIKEWYEEGVQNGSWKNRKEAIEKFEAWKENSGKVAKHSNDLTQRDILNTWEGAQSVEFKMPEDPGERAALISALDLNKQMSRMKAPPNETWKKSAISRACKKSEK